MLLILGRRSGTGAAWAAGAARAARAARKHVGNLHRKRLCHVAAQLLFFSFIFLDEAPSLFLGQIFSPYSPNFIGDPDHDLFGSFGSIETMLDRVAYIAPCDVGSAVNGEGDTV